MVTSLVLIRVLITLAPTQPILLKVDVKVHPISELHATVRAFIEFFTFTPTHCRFTTFSLYTYFQWWPKRKDLLTTKFCSVKHNSKRFTLDGLIPVTLETWFLSIHWSSFIQFNTSPCPIFVILRHFLK